MVGGFLSSSIVLLVILAVESFARLACFRPSLIPVKERERVSGKVQSAEGFQSKICELVSGKLSY